MDILLPFRLLRESLHFGSTDLATSLGILLLRAVTGLMIFYIHGWHKLLGGIAYLRDGAPWVLVEEIEAMNFPAPLASAFAATVAQLFCGLLLAIGLGTRLCGLVLTGTLSVAILQNLLAGRDPQLVLLYSLNVAALALLGGGRFSLDARLWGSGHATGRG